VQAAFQDGHIRLVDAALVRELIRQLDERSNRFSEIQAALWERVHASDGAAE